MAMRDLVSGGASCAEPGSSSSSLNPLGALANVLIGSSSKTQVSLFFPLYTPALNLLTFVFLSRFVLVILLAFIQLN